MKSKGRIIALLTDFGTGDPYVAAMKGVILSIHPDALVVDISHDIPRHDVPAAAYTLLSVAPCFPDRTIFVCVVDPGVGTGRRIICLRNGERLYLAPDNGILNYLPSGARTARWYSLKPPGRGLAPSATFHGRDIFAPAAARIAKGTPLGGLTRPIPALRARALFTGLGTKSPAAVKGKVLHIDHFGNIVTNIRMPAAGKRKLTLILAGRRISRVCTTYEEGSGRHPFMIRGSTGLLEISLSRGSAADELGVRNGEGAVLKG